MQTKRITKYWPTFAVALNLIAVCALASVSCITTGRVRKLEAAQIEAEYQTRKNRLFSELRVVNKEIDKDQVKTIHDVLHDVAIFESLGYRIHKNYMSPLCQQASFYNAERDVEDYVSAMAKE